MIVLPIVILMNAGNELTDYSGMRIVYSGVFGGLGGLIGFTANYLTKDKQRTVKIWTTLLIILCCGLVLYLL